ncbi:two-component response regulator ARR14-like [Lycium ferocissimum]|uniref:two-component response regulator ARR14-like n=1 Tax=Lycium ferocissimum TaxID=112874 RepID=UPI0028151B95|nr:two-component response regulator ARR14-like [Lycium ferocissimum]
MNFESSSSGVPSSFRGLRILLVDNDTTSQLNIASALEEHSFRVTTVELATTALSILGERIDEFDLVMADVMPEMDCFEFMRSTQLIKDIPITLMSSMMKRELVREAVAQGASFVYMKPISRKKLKNVWQHVCTHQISKVSQKPEHNKANNHVEVMDEPSGANKKIQDRKGKKIVNSTETYQDQEEGIMTLEKYEEEGSKRTRSTDEAAQVKNSNSKEEDHSLVWKNTMEGREKKRQRMEWTLDLDNKFKDAVCELGERARPKAILEIMNVPNLTQKQVANHLQRYRTQTRQAQYVQPANQSQIMSQMPPPLVPISHSQDGVNKGYHQFRFMRETRTSLQECHEEKQPLNVESTIGNLNSVFQRLSFLDNGHHLNTFNHFPDNGHHVNVLNSNVLPMNFNEPLQEEYLPQPPAEPSLVPPNDFFTGLNGWNQDPELDHFNGEIMTENQIGSYYNWPEKAPLNRSSTQDNISTRNRNP